MMTSDERWADLAEHAHKPTPADAATESAGLCDDWVGHQDFVTGWQRELHEVLDAALDVFDLRAKYPDTQVTYTTSYGTYPSTRPGRLDFHADLLLAAKDAKSSAAYKKIRGTK